MQEEDCGQVQDEGLHGEQVFLQKKNFETATAQNQHINKKAVTYMSIDVSVTTGKCKIGQAEQDKIKGIT